MTTQGDATAGAMAEPVNLTMVTFNRIDFTRQSIESIAGTAGHPYELTVVDNASKDGTVELLRDLHSQGVVHHLILNGENEGVAFAANQGWAAGGKAHYMKIDNDIVFRKAGWLARIVEVCDALPGLGAIAYNFETTSYPLTLVNGQNVRPKRGNLGGGCIMIPGVVHGLVGYWCEDYRPYGEEDYDMYVRLRQLGLRCFYMEDEDVGLHLPEGRATPLVDDGAGSASEEGDPAYRAQKDRWRARHIGPRGLRQINESLYRARLRPVYIPHAAPYRPSLAARLYVAAKFRRLDPWAAVHPD